jgi:hypothetical protein
MTSTATAAATPNRIPLRGGVPCPSLGAGAAGRPWAWGAGWAGSDGEAGARVAAALESFPGGASEKDMVEAPLATSAPAGDRAGAGTRTSGCNLGTAGGFAGAAAGFPKAGSAAGIAAADAPFAAGFVTLKVFWHFPQRMVSPRGPMRPSSTR